MFRAVSFLSYSLLIFLVVAHKLFQFVKEAFHIRKLAVDRSEADIGHLVDLFSSSMVSSPMRTLGISRS